MPDASEGFQRREQRLLDAAGALFARFGFDKTTVAEVAKDAGVSKGAIYLHFKSKEELFEALLRRELGRFNKVWLERVDADPRGGTISGMFKNMLLALKENAFVRAIFSSDVSVLGSYLHNPNGLPRKRRGHTKLEFVKRMQAAGAIRTELDPKVTAHIMNMLSFALVAMKETQFSVDDPPSFEDTVEAIGDLLERALAPPGGGNPDAGKAIVRALSEEARARSSKPSI